MSTEEQITEGKSIPAQLEVARSYASRKGLEIKSEHQFDESSIKDQRTKFELVIEEIRASKEPLALIVETIDRLQRSFKESVLLDEFRKQGRLEIHFIRENLVIHKNSNSSELQRWDLGVFMARSFVLQISDNVKRTIEHKLRNGEWPSRAPYGYYNFKNEDGKASIAPRPFESQIVAKMYEWYGSEAHSMEDIRFKLKNELEVIMSKGQIDFILKNPFYAGDMVHNGKVFHHNYQTIISKQLYDKVQSVKAGYHKKPCKFGGLGHLYRGLLRCAKCGHAFTPEKKTKKSGKEYVYYHCTGYSGKHPDKWLREEELTRQFSEIVKSIALPKEIADKLHKTLDESHRGKVVYYNEVYSGLEAEHKAIEGYLAKNYDHLLKGRITDDEHDKKRKELRERQAEIQSKLGSLQKADEEYYLTATYILKLASRAPEVFESSEPEAKRKILKIILQNCIVKDATLVPTIRSPFSLLAKGASRHEWLPVEVPATLVDRTATLNSNSQSAI